MISVPFCFIICFQILGTRHVKCQDSTQKCTEVIIYTGGEFKALHRLFNDFDEGVLYESGGFTPAIRFKSKLGNFHEIQCYSLGLRKEVGQNFDWETGDMAQYKRNILNLGIRYEWNASILKKGRSSLYIGPGFQGYVGLLRLKPLNPENSMSRSVHLFSSVYLSARWAYRLSEKVSLDIGVLPRIAKASASQALITLTDGSDFTVGSIPTRLKRSYNLPWRLSVTMALP